MSSVDNRVVELQFDNKDFLTRVSETIKSLGNLKKSLDLDKSTKSLNNVERAINGFDLSKLSSGIETVANRFSTLGIIGVTALQNITNAAINAGTQIVRALTIDSALGGFQEYEMQMNSILTILNNTKSKGSTLDDVNQALNELNTYADQTIYNFTEMTQNIGRFTAAGVDLQTSVDSIKGLSNLAAFFGSSSQQASSAMYQLSQAIAAGRVTLMDWNSVVNAGMGGPEFQNALKRTAENFGINVDAMIERYGSFRESLTQGQWLTADVLTETLKQISGAYTEEELIAQGYTQAQARNIVQLAEDATDAATKVRTFTQLMSTLQESMGSGWTTTWQLIEGDFNEATDNWSSIYEKLAKVIQKSADDRNALLEEWANLGGRTELWSGISAMFDAFLSYADAIKKGFQDIFPPATAQQLYDLTKGFHEFWNNAILSTEASEELRSVVSDFASVLKWVVDGVTGATDGLIKLAGGAGALGDGLFSLVKSISGFLKSLTEGIDLSGAFSFVLSTLGDVMSGVGRVLTFLGAGVSMLTSAFSGAVSSMTAGLANLTGGIGTASQGLTEIILSIIELVPEAIGTAISAIGDAVTQILESVPVHEVNAAVQDTLFTLILSNINKFAKGLSAPTDAIDELFGSIGEAVQKMGDALDAAKGSIKSFATSIKANALVKIAVALGILALSIKALADIPMEQIGSSLGALAGGVVIMGAAGLGIIAVLKKMAGGLKGAVEIASLASTLRKIATSMLLFALSVRVLADALAQVSTLSWDEMLRGLVAIAGSVAVLVAATKLLQKTKGITKTAFSLIVFSGAIGIMANALKSLGELEFDQIVNGLIAIGGSAAILVAAVKLMEKGSSNFIRSSLVLLMFSASIRVMAEAMKAFSDVDVTDILKTVGALAGLMAVLKLFSKTVGGLKIGQAASVAAVLLTFSVSLQSFAQVAQMFNDIDVSSIAKMSVSVGLLMAALAIFSKNLKGNRNLLEVSGGIWLVVDAINGLADAMSKFAGMSLGEVAKGLIGIAGGLSIALLAMNNMPDNTIDDSIAFIAVALSLKAIANAVKELGTMDIESIGRALLAFAGTMTILGVAAHALKGTAGGSGSLALFGLGLSLLIGPIQALGNMSLANIAKAIVGLAAALTVVGVASKVLGKMSGSILKTAASLVVMGAAITVFGIGLTAMMYPIKSLAELDSSELGQGVVSLAAVIATLFALVNTMNALPEFSVKTVAKVALMALVIAGVGAVIGQLASIDTGAAIQAAGALSSTLIATTVALKILETINVAGAAKAVATMGVIIGGMAAIVAAAGGIAQIPGAQWLVNEGASFLASIGSAIGGFFGGFIGGVAGGVISTIASTLPGLGAALSIFAVSAKPFFSIIGSVDPSSFEGIGALAGAVLALTAANVLESMTKIITGGNSLVQFGQQLALFAPYLVKYANTVAGLDGESVKASGEAAKSLAEFANAIPNEGGLIAKVTGENDIVTFGKKLALFGPYFMKYAASVAAIKGESVINSANAAKSMAEFASSLPNEGGWIAKITGENDIVTFGSKLAQFGPYFMKYAESISGLKPDTVVASANAAKALSEVANNIPAEGGALQWFTGEQDLGEFGNNLEQFGEGMKKYGEKVENVKPDAITASANAAKALVEVANSLEKGGNPVVEWFTGKKDLSEFGTSLSYFGDGMKKYGEKVSGLKTDGLIASATAAKALVEVGNALDESGGAISFFTGDQDLSGFGTNLPALGKGIAGYAKKVNGVNFDNVTTSVNALKTLSSIQSGLNESGGVVGWWSGDQDLGGFGDSLTALGEGIAGYANQVNETTFTNVTTSIDAINSLNTTIASLAETDTSGIGTMSTAITDLTNMGLSNLDEAFSQTAENAATAMEKMYKSLASGSQSIQMAFSTIKTNLSVTAIDFTSQGVSIASSLMGGLTEALDNRMGDIKERGSEMVSMLRQGMKSQRESVVSMARSIRDAIITAIGSQSKFEKLGKDMMQGLANGISRNSYLAEDAARNAANDALIAAKNAVDSNSPSKKFYQLGYDSDRGLAMGFSENSGIVRNAAASVATQSLNSMTSAISMVGDILARGDLLELHPVISPVLDLSTFSSGSAKMNQAISRSSRLAQSVSTSMYANSAFGQEANGVSNATPSVSFVQNNYSPKALSRAEIYRDTKNQLSRFKQGGSR